MVAYLCKSDASAGFDQIVDFLNAQVIQYALMVNPTIYVSCIKQFWASVSIKKVNDVVKLRDLIDKMRVVVTEDIICQDLRLDDADGVECLPTEEIFTKLAFLPWPRLSSALPQVESFISLSISLTAWIGKGFFGIETPLFATMLVQPQAAADEEDKEDEACTTLSHKVSALEKDKVAQALEILKLKRRVKKLEKQRRPKSSGLKRLRKVGGRIEEIDADEEITLVDMETEVELGAELQGRLEEKDEVNAAAKEVNVAEPTVFDNEEATMNMAQTLIKIKAKKARLLDEQMAKRLHDEEVEQAAARERQEQNDFKRAQELQQQFDQKQEILIGIVGGITQAYQSFEDVSKDFDREDLDALWRIRKENFSTAMPTQDKEKALWAELTRLYEPNADDVFWKLKRYVYYPVIWKCILAMEYIKYLQQQEGITALVLLVQDNIVRQNDTAAEETEAITLSCLCC
uniref:Xylulose kinase-1 n=1 Tax=Tanacetum cinerariifolium TaxID=118510 RepID=A0A6L2K1F0_TANCI|nr:hypothetical protein [Tanacetum cinerariifolium]